MEIAAFSCFVTFLGHKRLMKPHGEGLWSDCMFRCQSEMLGSRLYSCWCHDKPTASVLNTSQQSVIKLMVCCFLYWCNWR